MYWYDRINYTGWAKLNGGQLSFFACNNCGMRMSPALSQTCAPNSPDLKRVDYAIWELCRNEHTTTTSSTTLIDQLKQVIVLQFVVDHFGDHSEHTFH